MTTTNEAAERLRQWLAVDGRYVDAHPLIDNLVDAALTAERTATVERIRVAMHKALATKPVITVIAVDHILDAEAAR